MGRCPTYLPNGSACNCDAQDSSTPQEDQNCPALTVHLFPRTQKVFGVFKGDKSV
jgi:hypothetical protein